MVQNSHCIGCQVCVDLCPKKAISFQYDTWGEGKVFVNPSLCNNCRLCETRCPSLNVNLNPSVQNVFAAYSKKHRATGSSGGIFYELAVNFINNDGVVFGAAFDSNLKLIHKQVNGISELPALCKSKYLHSDMCGVYKAIDFCLKKGKKVMFVGTPCQVSAVKNAFLKYDNQLLLVDFLCHGTGTQKCFDACISNEENKRKGKIIDFTFRAKTRKTEHSFQYKILRKSRIKNITGYSFEFPYYFSYLKYCIFNEACYECKYAREERVGDITLGDFWGIQKYNRKLKDIKGVSMLSINTSKGYKVIDEIRKNVVLFEMPLESASSNNEAFRECVDVRCREKKHELVTILETNGEDALMQELSCKKITKELVYAKTPIFVKKLWNSIKRRCFRR